MICTCLASGDVPEETVVRVIYIERRDLGRMGTFTGWLICDSAVRFDGCLWPVSVTRTRVIHHGCVCVVVVFCMQ